MTTLLINNTEYKVTEVVVKGLNMFMVTVNGKLVNLSHSVSGVNTYLLGVITK
jgi:hypothetical protein